MMEKLQHFNPYHIAHTLNKMERRGGLGAPMDLFMQRPTKMLSPNCQNSLLDLIANEAARKNKAMKNAEEKNKRYSREFFEVGVRVIVQDQITNKWVKRGTVISSRLTHTDQGARSYVIETDDGRTYTRNTRFLTREPSQQASQQEREQAEAAAQQSNE